MSDAERITELERELSESRELFRRHTEQMGLFLSAMYALMVDPCSDRIISPREACDALLVRAKEYNRHILRTA